MLSIVVTVWLASEAQSDNQFVHLVVGCGYEQLELLGAEGMLPVWWRQKGTASSMCVFICYWPGHP